MKLVQLQRYAPSIEYKPAPSPESSNAFVLDAVLVNPVEVAYITRFQKTGAKIFFTGGTSVEVAETLEDAERLLAGSESSLTPAGE
jgi:hypothetical protein